MSAILGYGVIVLLLHLEVLSRRPKKRAGGRVKRFAVSQRTSAHAYLAGVVVTRNPLYRLVNTFRPVPIACERADLRNPFPTNLSTAYVVAVHIVSHSIYQTTGTPHNTTPKAFAAWSSHPIDRPPFPTPTHNLVH